MSIHYTSRRDLSHALFWLRCAFLALWLAFILYVTHQSPSDASWMLFLLPAIGFFGARLFPGLAFDFQGVVFAGTFFCCFLSPAIYDSAGGNRTSELMVSTGTILFAMGFGFALFRVMGKTFERIS